MVDINKLIVLSYHAREQALYRGCTEEEIQQTIRSAEWQNAEMGRLECRKEFTFNQDWNGKRYPIKLVRPVFVVEPDRIVVVTVYVYYA